MISMAEPSASHGDAIDSLSRLSVEQLRCCRIDAEQRRLADVPLDQLPRKWAESSNEIWISSCCRFDQDLQCDPLNPHNPKSLTSRRGAPDEHA